MTVASFDTWQVTTAHTFQYTKPTESTAATMYPAARDEFCTSLGLANEATTTGDAPTTARKLRHGGLSGWQNVQSGKSISSKIPVQPTPPDTLQHFSTNCKQENHSKQKSFRHGNVETTSCAIGQTITTLGSTPPRPMPTTKWQAHIFASRCVNSKDL